ncbi:hypothetical protein D3C79_955010 [compost metagenome]
MWVQGVSQALQEPGLLGQRYVADEESAEIVIGQPVGEVGFQSAQRGMLAQCTLRITR